MGRLAEPSLTLLETSGNKLIQTHTAKSANTTKWQTRVSMLPTTSTKTFSGTTSRRESNKLLRLAEPSLTLLETSGNKLIQTHTVKSANTTKWQTRVSMLPITSTKTSSGTTSRNSPTKLETSERSLLIPPEMSGNKLTQTPITNSAKTA